MPLILSGPKAVPNIYISLLPLVQRPFASCPIWWL